jgi:hypothetical protein
MPDCLSGQRAGSRLRLLLPLLLLLQQPAYAAGKGPVLHINPFVPPETIGNGHTVKPATEANSMELRGVVLAGERSLANIGGKVVAIGEEINGYRLIAVNENNVLLDNKGARRELRIRSLDRAGKDANTSGTW